MVVTVVLIVLCKRLRHVGNRQEDVSIWPHRSILRHILPWDIGHQEVLIIDCFLKFQIFFVVLWIKPKTVCMPDRCSTTEEQPQPDRLLLWVADAGIPQNGRNT